MRNKINIIKIKTVFFQFAKYLPLLFFFLIQCKKQVTPVNIEADKFLRVFQDSNIQKGNILVPSSDGGFLMLGKSILPNGINADLQILKTSSIGELEWKKTIPVNLENPLTSVLKDGNFISCSEQYPSKLSLINQQGEMLFNTSLAGGNNYFYSYPAQNNKGEFLIAGSNGQATGSASTSYVDRYSSKGNYINSKLFTDASFGGKVLYLNIYDEDDSGSYYFYGFKFTAGWKWTDNAKIFVSKQKYSGNLFVSSLNVTIDSANVDYQNFSMASAFSGFFHLLTPDKKLVLISTQLKPNGDYRGYFVVLDENLKILIEKPLEIGSTTTLPYGVSQTSEGNYLITGACKTIGKQLNQPFACVIGSDGRLLWSKIFETPQNSSFNAGRELTNGQLIFGGTSDGFGKGATLDDFFMMKTDKFGNIK